MKENNRAQEKINTKENIQDNKNNLKKNKEIAKTTETKQRQKMKSNNMQYKISSDKKTLGMIILIISAVLMIFGEVNVKFISSIPRYTTGMFFGYFNPMFYIFTSWVGIKMIFPKQIKMPKWLKINFYSYWVIVMCMMIIVQAWGWAAITKNADGSQLVKTNLIGGEPWKIGFVNWFKHFAHDGGDELRGTSNWNPNNYYGGVLGFAIWSTLTMIFTPIGSGIIGALGLAISISLIATGSFIGLFKNYKKLKPKKFQKTKNSTSEAVIVPTEELKNDTPDVEAESIVESTKIETLGNSNQMISNNLPFEDPFADELIEVQQKQKYKKIRATEVFNAPVNIDKSKLQEEIQMNAKKLNDLFNTFGIDAKVSDSIIGPTLTKYIITPGPGINLKKFSQLESNIKMALASISIRMELPIPGKSAIGVEVPNSNPEMVSFKEVFKKLDKKFPSEPLATVLGKTITGQALVIPINKTPHLLVAGATGSGKSVGINAMLMSMIMRTGPEKLRLVLVDPKMVEFMPYNDVPHLLCPVITDPLKASQALEGLVDEMEKRFQEMADNGVRNLEEYNRKMKNNPWPYIVVVIDELADLMNVAAKLVETSIQRITQKARAAGIHLIIATQRPSVNVVTGTIKANIPSRISFSVTSGVDSKVILDEVGAEKLMGKGDLLMSLYGKPIERCQGAYISNEEIQAVINKVKNLKAPKGPDLFAKFKTKKDKENQEANVF